MNFLKNIGLAAWGYVKARAVEPSTWAGIVGAVATAAGYKFAPGQADMIATVVAGLLSAILIGTKTSS